MSQQGLPPGLAYDLADEFAAVDAALDDADSTDAGAEAFDEHVDRLLTAPPYGNPTSSDEAQAIDNARLQWFNKTTDQLLRWYRNAAAAEAAVKAEVDRLQAKLRAAGNRVEAVRTWLARVMRAHNQTKVKTPVATAWFRAGSERLIVDEEHIRDHIEKWPPQIIAAAVKYPPPQVNKTVLKRDFSALLKDLPGVSQEVGPETLQVR